MCVETLTQQLDAVDTVIRIDESLRRDGAKARRDVGDTRADGEEARGNGDAKLAGTRIARDDRPGHVLPLASCGVALHAARVGGGAAARTDARGRGEAAFGPVRTDLDDMSALTQVLDRRLRHAVLAHEHAG